MVLPGEHGFWWVEWKCRVARFAACTCFTYSTSGGGESLRIEHSTSEAMRTQILQYHDQPSNLELPGRGKDTEHSKSFSSTATETFRVSRIAWLCSASAPVRRCVEAGTARWDFRLLCRLQQTDWCLHRFLPKARGKLGKGSRATSRF